MNFPAVFVLVCHFAITGLYFAGESSSNAELIKKISGVIKENVTITCKYTYFNLKPTLAPNVSPNFYKREIAELQIVSWQYYKHLNDRKNAQVIEKSDRFSSHLMFPLNTAQLLIKELLVTDAGFYFCAPPIKMKGFLFKREPDVTRLIINAVPISKIFLQVPQLQVNKSAILRLKAIGFYPKHIAVDWLKDKKKLQEKALLSFTVHRDGTFGATSTIALVPRVNDHGKIITCWITHKTMKTSRSLKLQVLYGPVDLRVQPGKDTVKKKGDPFNLSCMANSNPTALMSWRLNGAVLRTETTNRLTIKVENASFSDQGTYVCSAVNKLGMGNTTVVVTVIGNMTFSATANDMVIGISVSAMLLLIIVTSIITCALVRKCRATGQQEEEPVYMVCSHPSADVYETLQKSDTEEPSAQHKTSDGIYENVHKSKGFKSVPSKRKITKDS
ncbi:cell adhesion molecule 1-like [Heterodontus francisci]|uniref:cell adhesion molecule 1-like n=1 Tax=Heterodontus francisci TaxID=7792 RepID=UPI00355B610B